MATVEDYGSGRILRSIRFAHIGLMAVRSPFIGPVIARKLEERMEPFGIRPITQNEAGTIIEGCRCCAAGPRVCQSLFPDAGATESVFLDDLADQMIIKKKARQVTRAQALETLRNYPDNPLILSKVSGQYLEICRSVPEVCIYWKMKKSGLKI
jgi:hypothetical protein